MTCSRFAVALALLAAAVGSFVLPSNQALAACACDTRMSVKRQIEHADGAIVGVVDDSGSLDQKHVTISVVPEAKTKSVPSGPLRVVLEGPFTCGPLPVEGDRTGLLLKKDADSWIADDCSSLAPNMLRNALVRAGEASPPARSQAFIVDEDVASVPTRTVGGYSLVVGTVLILIGVAAALGLWVRRSSSRSRG